MTRSGLLGRVVMIPNCAYVTTLGSVPAAGGWSAMLLACLGATDADDETGGGVLAFSECNDAC